MGLFKELKNFNAQAKEMTKDYKRPGLTESLRQANETLADVQQQQAQAQSLTVEGLDGTATIGQLRSTGKTVNMFPEIEFDLQVTVAGGAPYPVSHRQVLDPAKIPMVQMGMTVPVKVDRNDGQAVFLMV